MKYIRIALIILISSIFLFFSFGCNKSFKQRDNLKLSNKLQSIVNSVIDIESEDPIYNAVLLVEGPNFKWKGASGMADGKNEPMTADHKIKIASITKTFTATIILQLVEEGYLNLNDRIDKYLDNQIVKIDSLSIIDGVAYGHQITIEHLLKHTSGIADYMEDPEFIPDVINDPKKLFNSTLIMEKYYNYHTETKAVFPPGKDFNYSDVNYVLLAMIIENVTDSSYNEQLKTRIFDKLDMKNSYLEYYEEPRGLSKLSHAYFSTYDLVEDINTSFDWGGGGIVTTSEELTRFFRELMNGKLFKKKTTLQLMLNAANEGKGGTDYDYGMGIMKRTIHGLTFYGHGGAYDCDVYVCPEKNISVCFSLNQMLTHGKRDEFLFQVVKEIVDNLLA